MTMPGAIEVGLEYLLRGGRRVLLFASASFRYTASVGGGVILQVGTIGGLGAAVLV